MDRASGAIRVHEFWCTIDCGVPVQPDNVIAQTESSIVYGLGLALIGAHHDRGRHGAGSRTSSTTTCRGMADLPRAAHQADPDAQSPDRAGQMATPLVPSAISNAVFQLTGVRLRQQPMLAERVKVALAETGTRIA